MQWNNQHTTKSLRKEIQKENHSYLSAHHGQEWTPLMSIHKMEGTCKLEDNQKSLTYTHLGEIKRECAEMSFHFLLRKNTPSLIKNK